MEGELLNKDFLNNIIKSQVEFVLDNVVGVFIDDLSKNYYLDDYLLTREEVANKLKISIRQIDNLKTSGSLKHCSVGRSVRFKNSEVLQYIRSLG